MTAMRMDPLGPTCRDSRRLDGCTWTSEVDEVFMTSLECQEHIRAVGWFIVHADCDLHDLRIRIRVRQSRDGRVCETLWNHKSVRFNSLAIV